MQNMQKKFINYVFWFTRESITETWVRDKFNSYIWCGKHFTTFEEKWLAMCRIQSYFEAGIPVWIPNSNPETLKSVKIKCKALVTVRCSRATRVMFLASHWASLQHRPPTQTPQLHHGFSTCYARQKTAPPKKLLDTALMKQCMKQKTIIDKLKGHSWHMKDRKILLVWYFGEQLPPVLTKRKTRKLVNSSKCKLNFRSE